MISFIIPIYNTPIDKLQRCFASVSQVKELPLECILVDDGSNQKVVDFCKQFVQEHSQFVYHRQENQGVSTARNVGITLAKGEYISFVDADDTILPSFYQKSLLNHTEDIVFSNLLCEQAGHKEGWKAFEFSSQSISNTEIFHTLAKSGKLYGPVCKLIKSSFLKNHHIQFRTSFFNGEDAMFLLDILAKQPSMYYIDEDSYMYFKEAGTGQNRLLSKPTQFIDNCIALYSTMLTITQNLLPLDTHLQNKIRFRFVKELFTSACELLLHKALYSVSKKQIANAVHTHCKGVALYREANYLKEKVFLFILQNRLWCLLYPLAILRNKALSNRMD